jgi:hypothetical protein
MPCLKALARERSLPSAVLGPVLLAAFRRFARIRASLAGMGAVLESGCGEWVRPSYDIFRTARAPLSVSFRDRAILFESPGQDRGFLCRSDKPRVACSRDSVSMGPGRRRGELNRQDAKNRQGGKRGKRERALCLMNDSSLLPFRAVHSWAAHQRILFHGMSQERSPLHLSPRGRGRPAQRPGEGASRMSTGQYP